VAYKPIRKIRTIFKA